MSRSRGCDALPVDCSQPVTADALAGLGAAIMLAGADVLGIDCDRRGGGPCARGLFRPHQRWPPAPRGCPRAFSCVAAQLSDLSPAHRCSPGSATGPSLTQADRFLLVFRVCFCLAPFEIGYDVGGKAATSTPRATACGVLEDERAEWGRSSHLPS